MPAERTQSYSTLRHTRTAIRVLAPVISSTLLLTGIGLFVSQTVPQLLATGYGVWERVIWGVIGLGYLMGFPIAGFVFFSFCTPAARFF
jgi:hypothetical protein